MAKKHVTVKKPGSFHKFLGLKPNQLIPVSLIRKLGKGRGKNARYA